MIGCSMCTMGIMKKSVLLLKAQKPEDGTDKYELLLRMHGFDVKQVKTLDFEYKNLNSLRDKLEKPHEYSGLIFSSPRSVYATYLALNKKPLQEEWKSKHNFVVGEATYNDTMNKVGLDCNGKETGNAKNLAELIVKGKSHYDKPFLFPHGNLKTDVLRAELDKESLSMEDVLVYDTIPNPHLEKELSLITNEFTTVAEYLVFYSPSGVRASIDYLRKLPVGLDELKVLAIGPVTKKALEDESLRVYSTAKSPTPEDVLQSIML